jgi:Fe-S-cluster-containing hydrogenase component 2
MRVCCPTHCLSSRIGLYFSIVLTHGQRDNQALIASGLRDIIRIGAYYNCELCPNHCVSFCRRDSDTEVTDSTKKNTPAEKTPQLQRSGVIEVDENLCLTCRECEVACSLYHESECNPSLSRIRIWYDDFVPGPPAIVVCKQCDWPACYYACASLWDEPAISIDEVTGARYIDPEKCRGCGACMRACPLTPERSVIGLKVGHKRIYFKCDLCRDRKVPVCVEICPGKALKFVPAEERSK